VPNRDDEDPEQYLHQIEPKRVIVVEYIAMLLVLPDDKKNRHDYAGVH
jgi:hypothetical protein